MTDEHCKYLSLLADALDERDPALFDMGSFATNQETELEPREVEEHPCGTVCCALGTAATVEGIPKPLPEEGWIEYGARIFGIDFWQITGCFLFGGGWAYLPDHNTPIAAAKRIRYYLATNEVPHLMEWIEWNGPNGRRSHDPRTS